MKIFFVKLSIKVNTKSQVLPPPNFKTPSLYLINKAINKHSGEWKSRCAFTLDTNEAGC